MLKSLLPKAHARMLALPLLGPIADGFDDWLAANGYTTGSRKYAIRMLPYVDNDLRYAIDAVRVQADDVVEQFERGKLLARRCHQSVGHAGVLHGHEITAVSQSRRRPLRRRHRSRRRYPAPSEWLSAGIWSRNAERIPAPLLNHAPPRITFWPEPVNHAEPSVGAPL